MESVSSYKGMTITTSGDLPKICSRAPNFLLISSKLEEVSLTSFANKIKLINIVPSVDLPTSIISASRFQRDIGERDDVVIMLISPDTPFTLNRVAIEYQLFNSISLSTLNAPDFALNYGVLISDGPLAGLTAQAVVVLDRGNRVLYSAMVHEVSKEPEYVAIYAALYGQLDAAEANSQVYEACDGKSATRE